MEIGEKVREEHRAKKELKQTQFWRRSKSDAKGTKKLDKRAEKTHHAIKAIEKRVEEDIKAYLADKTAKDLHELLDKYLLEHTYFRRIIKKQNVAELRMVGKLKKAKQLMDDLGLQHSDGDVKEVYDGIGKLLDHAHDEIEKLRQHARDVAHGRERSTQKEVYTIDRLFHAVLLAARDEKRMIKKVNKFDDHLDALIEDIGKNKAEKLDGLIKKLKKVFKGEEAVIEREIRDIAKIEHFIFNIAQRERKDDEHEIISDLGHLKTNGFPAEELQALEEQFKVNMDEIDHMNDQQQAQGKIIDRKSEQ